MGVPGYIAKGIGKALGRIHFSSTPKFEEVGKKLAKHGVSGFKDQKDFYSKCLADKRLSEIMAPPFRVTKDNYQQLIQELPKDEHVRLTYLQSLLKEVHKKDEIRTIIRYVKSAAANNLSPDDRAHLLAACLEKLKYVDLIAQFLH